MRRRDVVRGVCALGVILVAVLPATVSAAAPQVTVRSGRACGAAAYCITPGTLTVPVGSTVLWHNLTGAPLLVSRCSAATCPGIGPGTAPDTGPSSIPLGAGSELGQTFAQPGTYNYALVAGGIAVLSGTVVVTSVGSGTRLSRTVAAAPPPPVAVAPVAAAPAPAAPAGPLVPALAAHPPAAAAPTAVPVTPVTGADPPWALGVLLTLVGTGLLTAGRRRRPAAG